FLIFGLGFGMPLFVISLLAPAQQSWLLRQVTRHYTLATRLAGVLLIVVGVSDLLANLATIRLYL
ncbi:MAG: hypothetical protein ABI466_05160, partial [Chloroflexota bacterium]